MKKITFEGELTGAEILEKNPNLTGLDLNATYNYVQGEKLFDRKIECEINRVFSNEEKQEQTNLERKQELIKLMIEANALRDDVAWQLAKDEYDLL